MIRTLVRTAAVLLLALVGTIAILLATNAAPAVPAVTSAEASNPTKPYVVKLHAQWCPYCMLTKDEWSRIAEAYADRVNLVVMDFTTSAATERSRVEAERLGLKPFFDEYSGATGIVVVLDGQTKEVNAEIAGDQPFASYRAAIDAALGASTPVR